MESRTAGDDRGWNGMAERVVSENDVVEQAVVRGGLWPRHHARSQPCMVSVYQAHQVHKSPRDTVQRGECFLTNQGLQSKEGLRKK